MPTTDHARQAHKQKVNTSPTGGTIDEVTEVGSVGGINTTQTPTGASTRVFDEALLEALKEQTDILRKIEIHLSLGSNEELY
jgi:hypothetical protein